MENSLLCWTRRPKPIAGPTPGAAEGLTSWNVATFRSQVFADTKMGSLVALSASLQKKGHYCLPLPLKLHLVIEKQLGLHV